MKFLASSRSDIGIVLLERCGAYCRLGEAFAQISERSIDALPLGVA
jgi:hypothetical protein